MIRRLLEARVILLTMNLSQIHERFPTEADCLNLIETLYWNGKPQCPYCLGEHTVKLQGSTRYLCKLCFTTFSVTVKTVFHRTHMPLQKWFLAISLILNPKSKITVRELASVLQVNKNTAGRVLVCLDRAITQTSQRQLLLGILERIQR